MPIYCPKCGRSIPDDSRMCPYCSGLIDSSAAHIKAPKQKKETNVGLIIAIILVVIILGTIAIAATVYVYVSGMIDTPSSYDETPSIYFAKDSTDNTLTVTYVDSYSVLWSELEFTGGTCDTSNLVGFVREGDEITDCQGTITVIYEPTYELLGAYTFD